MLPQEVLDRLYTPIYDGLTRLDDEAREKILSMIREDFCIYCGKMYKREGERCHCQNDE